MTGPEAETALLAAWAAGDRSAAERLVALAYRPVFRLLCRLTHGDEALAADLTQEAFRRCWAALDRFEGRSSFTTWVCRAAYNAFFDEARARRSRPTAPLDGSGDGDRGGDRGGSGDAAERVADPGDGAAAVLIRAETEARLRRAVLALPAELRFAVVAHYWGEVPVADIARAEGLSEMGLRKRLQRARTLLSEALRSDGGGGERP